MQVPYSLRHFLAAPNQVEDLFEGCTGANNNHSRGGALVNTPRLTSIQDELEVHFQIGNRCVQGPVSPTWCGVQYRPLLHVKSWIGLCVSTNHISCMSRQPSFFLPPAHMDLDRLAPCM